MARRTPFRFQDTWLPPQTLHSLLQVFRKVGQENVNLFLDLVDELNAKEIALFDGHKLDTFSAHEWIQQKLEKKLKAKGLLESFKIGVFRNPPSLT